MTSKKLSAVLRVEHLHARRSMLALLKQGCPPPSLHWYAFIIFHIRCDWHFYCYGYQCLKRNEKGWRDWLAECKQIYKSSWNFRWFVSKPSCDPFITLIRNVIARPQSSRKSSQFIVKMTFLHNISQWGELKLWPSMLYDISLYYHFELSVSQPQYTLKASSLMLWSCSHLKRILCLIQKDSLDVSKTEKELQNERRQNKRGIIRRWMYVTLNRGSNSWRREWIQ